MSTEKFEPEDTIQIQEVDEVNGITRESTQHLMRSSKIMGAAVAACRNGGIFTMPIGETLGTEASSPTPVRPGTVFEAASLSKPVFAYLVLKLIEMNKINRERPEFLGKFKTEFDLKTPLYTLFRDTEGQIIPDDENPFLKRFLPNQNDQAKLLSAEMVLSHRTGLHITDEEPFKFQFPPGKYYAYSGPGIDCLQGAIKELTGVDLETLAQEYVFGPRALNMPNSSYGPKPVAANSLRTTAEEYAKFITAWINDDQLNYAFRPIEPIYSMINDFFPYSEDKLVEKVRVSESDREQVTWGLGIGLVKNSQGQIIGAYHTGDMDKARAGFGAEINPQTQRCIATTVYFANTHNGHLLAEHVLPSTLEPALNYFFPTYGFARNVEELDGTDFHGLNPKILNPELKERAYKTRSALQNEEQPGDQTTEKVEKKQTPTAYPTTPKPPWEY
ncbi:TPA: serine hydrolase domain-containing protein [Legionella feeleii]